VTSASGGSAAAGPLAFLIRAVRWLDRLSYGAIVVVMAVMTGLVALQVFYRYVLTSSIDAADELSRLFFVWSMFLAIPHGLKYGVHIGIDLFVGLLPSGLQDLISRVVSASGMLLMAIVFAVGYVATVDKWPELMPTLPVTAGLYYVAVLLSAGHAFVHLLILTWGGPRTWEGEQP
jgi:TRAP-type C4-dicarboxylate transport system permease small subunit